MLRGLSRWARASAVLVSILSAAFGGIRQTAAGEAVGIPRIDIPSTSKAPSESSFALEQFYRGTDGALKEFGAARGDHAAIALDIGQCYHEKFGNPLAWSPTVRAILFFELDENLMHRLQYTRDEDVKNHPAKDLPVLDSFHAAAISFSDRISRNRLEFRRELEDKVTHAYWYQFLILGLGAATTILVSARAVMQGNSVTSAITSVSAIVFSAVGVAVASMNTFEGSQAIILRDQRALAQLQQLHWRVASDVLQQHALCKNTALPPVEAMKVADAWRSRLETILDSAMESISKPGDLSSGQAAEPVKTKRVLEPSTIAASR